MSEEKRFPSLIKMAMNLAAATATHVASGMQNAPDEIIQSRRIICQLCDRRDPESDRCFECGCFLSIKTKLATSFCELHKWGASQVAKDNSDQTIRRLSQCEACLSHKNGVCLKKGEILSIAVEGDCPLGRWGSTEYQEALLSFQPPTITTGCGCGG